MVIHFLSAFSLKGDVESTLRPQEAQIELFVSRGAKDQSQMKVRLGGMSAG